MSTADSNRRVIVVGAGAAGLMAAIFAARGGCAVHVIERTAEGGKKILISGGGRCNVLPSTLAPERFVTESAPHIMRGLLRSWPLARQRAFFEDELAIALTLEEETGKLFPASNRARDVRDALLREARKCGAIVQFGTSLVDLTPGEEGWAVQTTREAFAVAGVIVATGGLSVPATGSDGTGLRILERLGHQINPLYPALTPLTADPAIHASLSGVSLHVRLRARAAGQRSVVEASGGFLFTHRGYSGPSVLDVSHVATRHANAVIRVQWASLTPDAWESRFAASAALVSTIVAEHVPQRLAARLIAELQIPTQRKASELRRSERTALIAALTSYVLPWNGDEGFKKAEVTGGGVALDEVDPRTLESRRHRGLFLCGEMLDAFGPIGGHNFAWAWSTGRLAGLGAASRVS